MNSHVSNSTFPHPGIVVKVYLYLEKPVKHVVLTNLLDSSSRGGLNMNCLKM